MKIDYDNLWHVLTEHSSLGEWSLHGPDHWRRVERNGVELAEAAGADVDVVRLFAVFHDSCRENEGFDPEHGERATILVLAMHGDLFQLHENQLEQLCEACSGHHHGGTSDLATVGACWDADRLDLPRVGMAPDEAYMSTEEGRRRAAAYYVGRAQATDG
mgnify:CR=1 FL=1